MIMISGTPLDIAELVATYPADSVESTLLHTMNDSTYTYRYDSLDELKFELQYRREIMAGAIALHNSRLNFSTFEESTVNPAFWERTENGGFLKKTDVDSSAAIRDIFANGGQYATECATAMTLLYYKALLEIMGDELFNKMFPSIYLMDWDVREPLLREITTPIPRADVLLGDRGYFENPDVNPETPQWQGENVIVLPQSLYYGHGIGIAKAETIIEALNGERKEGATQSASFYNGLGRPNFKKIYRAYQNALTPPVQPAAPPAALVWRSFPSPISNV